MNRSLKKTGTIGTSCSMLSLLTMAEKGEDFSFDLKLGQGKLTQVK